MQVLFLLGVLVSYKTSFSRGLFLIVSHTRGVLEIELKRKITSTKKAHSKEASHDMHVVTSTRSMYIARPKIPYFFPESPYFSFAFYFVYGAASDSDKTALSEGKV